MRDLFFPNRDSSAGGGSVVVMLALNLIVLALFILLNSFAKESAHKTIDAIEGVNEGFDYREVGQRIGSDDTPYFTMPWHITLQDGLRGLIHTQLLIDTPEFEGDANMVRVTFPAETFFAAGSSQLLPGRRKFLENMAKLNAPVGDAPPPALLTMTVGGIAEELSLASARMQTLTEVVERELARVLTSAVRVGQPVVMLEFRYQEPSMAAGRIQQQMKPLGGTVRGVQE